MSLGPKLEFNPSTTFTAVPTVGWVDISAYVSWEQDVTVTRGRSDEQAAVTPSTFSCTLDNLDGRFTPGNASGAYYPNITIPLWIRFTVVDAGAGISSPRFTGLVDSWDVDVRGPNSHRVTVVTATDQLQQMSRFRQIKSALQEEIMQDAPLAYYPCDDGSGAVTFTDQSGNLQPPLYVKSLGGTGTLDSGGASGPPGSGGTAPNFDPDYSQDGNNPFGKYLQTTLTTPLVVGNGHSYTLEWWMKINDDGNSAEAYAQPGFWQRYYAGLGLFDTAIPVNLYGGFYKGPFIANPAPSGGPYVFFGESKLFLELGSIQSTTVARGEGGPMQPGIWYHCVITSDGGTTDWSALFYLNGHLLAYVNSGTSASVAVDPPPATVRNLTNLYLAGFPNLGGSILSGSVAHAALYQSKLTQARVTQHYLAGRNGFHGEALRDRVVRVLKYAGLGDQSASASVEAAGTPVIGMLPDTAANLLHALETTEQGFFFIDPAGAPTFYNRSHRYVSTVLSLSASPTSGNIGSDDLKPILDSQRLVNDVTTTTGTGASARAMDAASIATRGTFQTSVTTVAASPTNADETSRWIISGRSTPLTRIPTVSVDILTQPAIQASVLGAKLLDQIVLTSLPTGYALNTMTIEGISEAYSISKQTLTFTVIPNMTTGTTYTVGVAGLDEIDTSSARLGF